MQTALAILTFVPAGASPGVRRRLPAALASLNESGYSGPVYVVDDGSTDDEHLVYLESLSPSITVVRRPENGGISRAKNTCLRVLADMGVDVGFLAEDDIAFFPGWFEAYVTAHHATGIHHFSWAWDQDPSGQMNKEIRQICGYPVLATTLVNGVFLSFTPAVMQQVGGFKILPAVWGHEHTHWTKRIILAGLAPFFADIVDSNYYLGLNAEAVASAIGAADRKKFAMQNLEPAEDLTPLFLPIWE
jgi:glycosyltransferase involved in cell wall biosynthesis